ncbi:transposable element Tcb2 transposase [Trichonephila clavipes]|nr:transposable element Tcb2 transposase [Trichonephila clavipes]
MKLQKRRSGDQYSEHKKSLGRLHTWKNDRKAGGGAYRHSCSCSVRNQQKCRFARLESVPNHRYTAIRKVGGGHPRMTTAGNDRYIILQAKRGRRQSASVIAQQLSTATGRQVSRFTVARGLHNKSLFVHRPERCLPLKVDHRRYRLQCTRSDSQRVLTWREIETRFYTGNIKERHHYGGPGVLVWGGIILNGRTELHIFKRESVIGDRYCEEVLLPHVRLFRGVIDPDFIFMDDNPQSHRVAAVAEWYRYRTMACLITSSSPVPLKIRRVGQRCKLNLSRAETSSRWCGVVVTRGGCQLTSLDHGSKLRGPSPKALV